MGISTCRLFSKFTLQPTKPFIMRYLLLFFVVFFNFKSIGQDLKKYSNTVNSEIEIADDEDYTSENKLYKIVLDYENKSGYRLPKKIKKGDLYQIVVKNINLNRYSVSINNKDSIYKSVALAFPTFSNFSLDALSSLTAGFNPSSLFSEQGDISSDSAAMEKNLENLHLRWDIFMIDIDQTALETKEVYDSIISVHQVFVKENELKLKSTISQFDTFKSELNRARLNQLASEYNTSFSDTVQFYKSYDMVNAVKDKIKKNIAHVTEEYGNYKKVLLLKEIKLFIADSKNKEDKERSELITKAYKELIKKNNLLLEETATEKIVPLMSSILFMNKPNRYKSFPIQFRSDLSEITITKTPRDTTGILDTERVTFSFPLKNDLEYWNIGTSFYYSGLSSDRFSTITNAVTDSTSVVNVINEGRSNGETGISINFRYGKKFGLQDKLGMHVAIGPGISIEKDFKPRVLGGFGFSYGKKHNFIVDFGGIIGYVDRQSNALDLDVTYTEAPTLTLTELKFNYYFSLGYSFTL